MPAKLKAWHLVAQTAIGFFIVFTLIVSLKLFSKADTSATVLLQAIFPRFLDVPFSVLSLIGSFEITAVILIAIVLLTYGRKLQPMTVAWSFFISGTLVELSGKLYLFHPSPPKLFFRSVGILFPPTYIHTNYSYPSGHMFRTAFIMVLVIYILGAKYRQLKIISTLILLLIVMAVSRIYLGEHWLSDVVGGTLLGAFFGSLSVLILQKNKTNLG